MAPGVPLDGSATVPGLHQLLAAGLTESIPRFSAILDKLNQAPRSWSLFWRGREHEELDRTYDLPACLDMLRERMEVIAVRSYEDAL